MEKHVYFFGAGHADGDETMKSLLGSKGANLAQMVKLGIRVPPGFTISTKMCAAYYAAGRKRPAELDAQIDEALRRLEEVMGQRLGDPENPLLVSVRSGAPISMPGMMNTVLNIGLNDETLVGLARRTNNERMAYDSYRRLLQMYGDVVLGVPHEKFEERIDAIKKERGITADTDLTVDDLKRLVNEFKQIILEHTGKPFPMDAKEQLLRAIDAVFESWNTPRAVRYRQIRGIPEDLGTAVNVQAMVFGNTGNRSCTGVAFTRNPSTGEKELYGEFLVNAQGEDVVAGIRTPSPISELKTLMPEVYEELADIARRLEQHYRDVQDIEFTVEEGRLYMLQTRTGQRTAQAAVRIAVDMVDEGLIDKRTAVMRVTPDQVAQLLHKQIAPGAKVDVIAKGLPASPGAATGQIVFTAHDAEKWAAEGKEVILVRRETSPDDIGGMHAAAGILTSRGGMTSHAAVVARGMGKCCVAGASDLHVDEAQKKLIVNGRVFHEGDWLTINGSTGEVMAGKVELVDGQMTPEFERLLQWADEFRALGVRANADTPEDAARARRFGAEGVGLCRTEHMFFGEGRIQAMQEMIVAADETARRRALEKLLPYQREDFYGIFKAMDGLPVTIRLLDPPLHEFLPKDPEAVKVIAAATGVSEEAVKQRVAALQEFNPMLGHRGCRLAITYPEIYEMQTRAIMEAAVRVAREGGRPRPEIMIPLVGTVEELRILREKVQAVADAVLKEAGVSLEYHIGTMIEVPRAALLAGEIAKYADFFSFGTNDLTQMTFGISRDDAGTFLHKYLEQGVLEDDPFQTLDEAGVGELVRIGVERGRAANPHLHLGICGEHGGDPKSIAFCHRVGLDYVSCSPYRVPVARLAAARANLEQPR
ncbi:MAG: pyruvate, phosphate dikinase [Bacillota bacterium]|nr:pyruvate, phosphate dikinase [Bacillota bacterium]